MLIYICSHEEWLYLFRFEVISWMRKTTREAIRRTVDFKRIDLAKYKVRSSNEFQTLLGYLVISLIFAYLHG